ncbi:MAG: spore coat protein [Peptococcaceae bacterium]
MNNYLTQKEKMLLQDQQKHEELCIRKYQSYANQAQTQELKQLFNTYAGQEQQHLDTINQMLNGQIPNVAQQGSQQQQNSVSPQIQRGMTNTVQTSLGNQSDKNLCVDALTTEKYVSGTYDTAIFEFTNPQLRQVLNHIQKEEQQHGEGIFNYMQKNGMYNPQ